MRKKLPFATPYNLYWLVHRLPISTSNFYHSFGALLPLDLSIDSEFPFARPVVSLGPDFYSRCNYL